MKEALRRTVMPLAATALLAMTLIVVGVILQAPSAQGQGPAPDTTATTTPDTRATSTPDTATSTPDTTATSTPDTTATSTPDTATTTPDTSATSTPDTTATSTSNSSSTTTPNTPPTHRAQINFGQPVGDVYIETILERHEAKLTAAYMTTYGFFGAHRAATSTAPDVFIASARSETAAGFSNGSEGGTTTRARDFVGTYTAQDVASDAETRKRAESLVGLHARLDAARATAADGFPLIYAVEVTGAESRLRLLGQEGRVVGFKIEALTSDVRWTRPELTGGPSIQSAPPAAPTATDPQKIYERLSALASR